VGKDRRQIDQSRCLIDGRGLYDCNLMLAQRLAHDVEAAREWRVAKGPLALPSPAGVDCPRQRLFGINEFGLGLRKGRR
jgi:hypothetical protein